ncbi:hypothetical protein ASG89_18300 [Paenibacillus sp. Soil766]|nr:hypothetical protein ASG89_18300 [Paenibacillus sp. Soil766]
MKIQVDITESKFDDYYDTVDFYDGKTLFFDITTKLPKNLEIMVWGASLMPRFSWNKYVSLESETRLREIVERSENIAVQIQGFGKLSFKEVIAGKIEVSPCDMSVKGNYTFFKDRQGKTLSFRKEWNMDFVDNDCYEYNIDSNIAFPYGHCDLKLYAKGKVLFEFDTDDCVHYHDYLLNPNRQETFFGFVKNKELSTNTFDDFEI